MTEWKNYEDVSRYLLDRFKEHFKLKVVEGKQSLPGVVSGTDWEIDAKGVSYDDGANIIIEARRYTTSKQNQEKIAGLAYRIMDIGAKGGIIVSPLGLQEGAKKVADASNIVSVKIRHDSTPENFTMEFFGNFILGVGTGKIGIKGFPVTITVNKNA